MKRVDTFGYCLSCKSLTNIKLDCGKYACKECLDYIGQQQSEIRKIIFDLFDNKNITLKLEQVIYILELMKTQEIYNIDTIINSLKAIIIHEKILEDKLSEKKLKKIIKMVDEINNI